MLEPLGGGSKINYPEQRAQGQCSKLVSSGKVVTLSTYACGVQILVIKY